MEYNKKKKRGNDMEEFYIDSDGTRLHAKLDRVGEGKSPLCILIHGFTGHMEEDHIIAAQKAMNEMGVSVLRVEMYGHGGSDGEFRRHTLYKWVTNALSAVEYAKTLDFVTDLYLSGHSQGGLLTMLVGGMCADDFKAIIPMSPAWMIPEEARKGTLLGLKFDAKHLPEKLTFDDKELFADYIRVAQTIHVEDEIARYRGPVYIIHGDEDDCVPFYYAKKALKLYKNAKLTPIHGDDHCFTKHLDQMYDAVKACFAK
jgi:alpha/beta superfamily hydrolase